MRRPSKSPSQKLSADSHRLITFSQAIVQSASRLEERAWERSLDALIQKLLKSGHQETIDAALEQLFKTESGAYEAMMETVEAASESCVVEQDGVRYDALLIAAPILAWTRFSIASGPIAADMLTTLTAHLYAHVLAADTRVALAPTLFAIDQLPRSHVETFAVTQRMAQAALKGGGLRPLVNPPETAPFLADTRYVMAVVTAPSGNPLFRWQASGNLDDRAEALAQWQAQAMPNIVRLLPGCGIELLLPEAYFMACREADKQIRPASIRAAVHFLTHTLAIEASGLQAIIGRFGEDFSEGRVDEYRIGFTQQQSPDVVYGVVWPLYGPEDDESPGETSTAASIAPGAAGTAPAKTPMEEILGLLRECGITDIKQHSDHFPMEFCDDCGAPLYPDPEAELVHAEMPEDTPHGAGHFH